MRQNVYPSNCDYKVQLRQINTQIERESLLARGKQKQIENLK